MKKFILFFLIPMKLIATNALETEGIEIIHRFLIEEINEVGRMLDDDTSENMKLYLQGMKDAYFQCFCIVNRYYFIEQPNN